MSPEKEAEIERTSLRWLTVVIAAQLLFWAVIIWWVG